MKSPNQPMIRKSNLLVAGPQPLFGAGLFIGGNPAMPESPPQLLFTTNLFTGESNDDNQNRHNKTGA